VHRQCTVALAGITVGGRALAWRASSAP
jgi:hypothetical protein